MGNRAVFADAVPILGIAMADPGHDSPTPDVRLYGLEGIGEMQQFLAAIVESSDDAIFSKSLDNIILSWNRGCERLFGYVAEEAIGRSAAMLHPSNLPSEEPMILARLRRGEKIDHYETVRRRKDGSLVDISLSVSPIRDQSGTIVGASKVARDITERKRAAEQQNLLLGEMRHRVKNLSAVIEALARQSRPRGEPMVDAFVDAFMGRVRALLSTGELLLGTPQRNVEMKQLLEKVVFPFVESNLAERVVLQGPSLMLPERTAGNLALALHELATNALKYGTLKAPLGKIFVTWSVEAAAGDRRVEIGWRESGGKPITSEPESSGFGSRVIATALASERDGVSEMHFERDGLRCLFRFTLSDMA
jgi:PAS domain S-box-containing protein